LQSELKDPGFLTQLQLATAADGDTVVRPSGSTDFIITYDDESQESGDTHSPSDYLNLMTRTIEKALSGAGVRDALFDYQLLDAYNKNPNDASLKQQVTDRVSAYASMAADAYNGKDSETAIALYNHALNLDSKFNYARIELAAIYADQKNTGAAKAQLSLAESNSPTPSDLQLIADVNKIMGS
jgi:tetratricopeptide (TPR) repeat protein